MYWKLSEHYQRHSNKAESRRCLQLALTSIETALSLIGRLERLHVRTYVGVSFYIGDAGIYALASVVYCRANQLDKSKECLELLLSQCDKALQVEEDEVLYGRAGYLFCLLFVEKYLPGDLPTDKLRSASKGVAEVIIESGIKGSRGRKHLRYHLFQIIFWCLPACLPACGSICDSIVRVCFHLTGTSFWNLNILVLLMGCVVSSSFCCISNISCQMPKPTFLSRNLLTTYYKSVSLQATTLLQLMMILTGMIT